MASIFKHERSTGIKYELGFARLCASCHGRSQASLFLCSHFMISAYGCELSEKEGKDDYS